MNNTPNKSIRCTVEQCKYNCKQEKYCMLDQVDIGTHEANPTVPKCVDCNSFVAENK
ncbi:MAG: DUF1540 domain-containing protein [Oscillospiraceae bacterium]|jgi:hypothetical protein|nr:DUF1540 domain-containing protein [Oscillospiraceae bacterium]